MESADIISYSEFFTIKKQLGRRLVKKLYGCEENVLYEYKGGLLLSSCPFFPVRR